MKNLEKARFDLERLEAWGSALLSGDFEQGEGYLFREDKYCCLGVACVLAHDANQYITLPWLDVLPTNGWPSPEVNEWFGGILSSLELEFDTGAAILPVEANDGAKKSFLEIGNAILRWVAEERKRRDLAKVAEA